MSPRRFRPWLQAFRDYAFDKRAFTGKEISAQTTAAEDFGSGWMLWNPRNVYSKDGLENEDPALYSWQRTTSGEKRSKILGKPGGARSVSDRD